MITPKLKDDILQYLVNNSPEMSITGGYAEIAAQFETNKEIVNSIIKQFEEKGFIKYNPLDMSHFHAIIRASAHDYILKGGYLGEFEYFERQVQKLSNMLYICHPVKGKNVFKAIYK